MRNAPAYTHRAHCGLQNFAEKTFTDGSETAKTRKFSPSKVFHYTVVDSICFCSICFGSEPQTLHYCHTYVYVFHGAGERNRGYALLMTANKPETVLYRAPTFSLLLASHGGISSCTVQFMLACDFKLQRKARQHTLCMAYFMLRCMRCIYYYLLMLLTWDA